MNKKHLRYAVGILAASFFLMIVAMLAINFKYPNQSQGKLVFSKSYGVGLKINKIAITSALGPITLELKDNLWRVREKGGYYASTKLLNALFANFNASSLFSQQEATQEAQKALKLSSPETKSDTSGVKVQTFIGDEVIDSVVIGKATENKLYHFAKLENGDIWQISGQYDLPEEDYSWMLQPILELPSALVQTIKFHENGQVTKVERPNKYRDFEDVAENQYKAQSLLAVLSRLIVEDATSDKNFMGEALVLSRRLQVTSFQGLVIDFDFYEDAEESVWIRISLSTTVLPLTVVNDYIKDNKFLYEGWFFKLPTATQKIMTPASLI